MKSKDINVNSEDAAVRLIAGTARSMGIEVVG
jgi:ribosomal protein L11